MTNYNIEPQSDEIHSGRDPTLFDRYNHGAINRFVDAHIGRIGLFGLSLALAATLTIQTAAELYHQGVKDHENGIIKADIRNEIGQIALSTIKGLHDSNKDFSTRSLEWGDYSLVAGIIPLSTRSDENIVLLTSGTLNTETAAQNGITFASINITTNVGPAYISRPTSREVQLTEPSALGSLYGGGNNWSIIVFNNGEVTSEVYIAPDGPHDSNSQLQTDIATANCAVSSILSS